MEELDLYRAERSAAMVNRVLRMKGVSPIRRAVCEMMILHPRSVCPEGQKGVRKLSITLRPAARWIKANVAEVQNMTCDHTAVMKALQFWCDKGVFSVVESSGSRTWWMSAENLNEWNDMTLDADEPPVFKPVTGGDSVVTGGDRCCPPVTGGDWVVTAGDDCCPVVPGGDSQRREEEEEDNNKTSLPPPQSSELAELPNTSNDVTAIIRELPELPVEVWDATRSESALYLTTQSWWLQNTLDARCGDHGAEVAATVAGLLLAARAARSPPAYYATCLRNGIRHHVTRQGRAWLDQQRRQRNGKAAVR